MIIFFDVLTQHSGNIIIIIIIIIIECIALETVSGNVFFMCRIYIISVNITSQLHSIYPFIFLFDCSLYNFNNLIMYENAVCKYYINMYLILLWHVRRKWLL